MFSHNVSHASSIQKTSNSSQVSIGGFLHEFSIDGKIHPEVSIYIPKTTIIPSIDISYLAQHPDDTRNDIGNKNYTIRILRSPGALQREKSYLFLVNTRLETLEWGRSLVDLATRHKKGSPSWKRIKRRNTAMESNSSSPAMIADGKGLRRSATQPHSRRNIEKPTISDRRASVPHISQPMHNHKENNEPEERKESVEKKRNIEKHDAPGNNDNSSKDDPDVMNTMKPKDTHDTMSHNDRSTAPEDSIQERQNASDKITIPTSPEDDTGACYIPQLRHTRIEQSTSQSE